LNKLMRAGPDGEGIRGGKNRTESAPSDVPGPTPHANINLSPRTFAAKTFKNGGGGEGSFKKTRAHTPLHPAGRAHIGEKHGASGSGKTVAGGEKVPTPWPGHPGGNPRPKTWGGRGRPGAATGKMPRGQTNFPIARQGKKGAQRKARPANGVWLATTGDEVPGAGTRSKSRALVGAKVGSGARNGAPGGPHWEFSRASQPRWPFFFVSASFPPGPTGFPESCRLTGKT